VSTRRFDFAVIGAGPAGASAARRLAQGGASVAVFERQRFPRAKPCGGGLSGRAMCWLDFPLPPDLIDAEVYGGFAHIGPVCFRARVESRTAVQVTRSRFDAFLLSKAEEAGAHVEWQEVRSLDVRPGEVSLATPGGEFAARCAVVCEGANRKLGWAVRGRDPPAEIGFCITADIPVPSPDPYGHLRDMLDIYFQESAWPLRDAPVDSLKEESVWPPCDAPVGSLKGIPRHGYGWIFHHGSYYSIGTGGLCCWFDSPLATFRRFVAERGLSLDGVRPRGHFLPRGGVSRRVSADRLILAGDAAGWVDPFQGEGMAYAIRSGQLAAETLLEAARRDDFSRRSLAAYNRRCDEAFGRDLRAARLITYVVHRWPSVLLRSVRSTETVLTEYMRVPRGDLSYRDFLRWVLGRAPRFLLRTQWQKITAAPEGS
jgi:flavin-dependent dehydrogenase